MSEYSTVEETYNDLVGRLTLRERIKLAAMILTDISDQAEVDYSEEWSDEDIEDFTKASWSYALNAIESEERDAPTG